MRVQAMTTAGIARIIDSYLTDLEGQPGFWRGMREDVQVYVFSDESHDRLRLMAPVGELKEPDPRILQVLLQANYDRALDAKYAMRGLELWSVSVHPLATLAPDDFASFIDQVVKLVKNTGSSYASSDLVFLSTGNGEGEEGGGSDGDAGDAGEAAAEDDAAEEDEGGKPGSAPAE